MLVSFQGNYRWTARKGVGVEWQRSLNIQVAVTGEPELPRMQGVADN